MREDLVDSILGCIVGGAIGDAAGAAFEGMPGCSVDVALQGAGWQLTDDTQLTLATCEAIVDHGSPDPGLIAASFRRWFRGQRLTGLGASTLKALRDLDAGAHWALAGRKGERGAGNGAAMRIAPLAFCVDPIAEESRPLIRDICWITHHNDEANIGALAVVLAVWGAKGPGWSLAWIASELPDTSVRDRLLAYSAQPPKASLADAASRFGSSGYVVESVPFALFAARRAEELGFAGMLRQVIAAGGDTDTNGSIAGQIAGTSLGLRGLPAELLERLPEADLVLDITRAFAEWVVKRG
jgi:ADP-ribosylglycohydrolase